MRISYEGLQQNGKEGHDLQVPEKGTIEDAKNIFPWILYPTSEITGTKIVF